MNKNKLLSRSSLCLLAFLMAIGITMTVQAQQGLIVKSNTGSTTSLSYTNVYKLTFVNEIMTAVKTDGVSGQSFTLATTQGFRFGDVSISGLKDPSSGNSDMSLYPTLATDNLYLKGAAESSQGSVYSITGSKIMQFQVQSSIENINVSNLKQGVYLMRVNGQTFKFYKK